MTIVELFAFLADALPVPPGSFAARPSPTSRDRRAARAGSRLAMSRRHTDPEIAITPASSSRPATSRRSSSTSGPDTDATIDSCTELGWSPAGSTSGPRGHRRRVRSLWWTISPGVAISQEGDELVLCWRATSDLCLGSEVCYVTVRLVERPTSVDADHKLSGSRGTRRSRWSRTSPQVSWRSPGSGVMATPGGPTPTLSRCAWVAEFALAQAGERGSNTTTAVSRDRRAA